MCIPHIEFQQILHKPHFIPTPKTIIHWICLFSHHMSLVSLVIETNFHLPQLGNPVKFVPYLTISYCRIPKYALARQKLNLLKISTKPKIIISELKLIRVQNTEKNMKIFNEKLFSCFLHPLIILNSKMLQFLLNEILDWNSRHSLPVFSQKWCWLSSFVEFVTFWELMESEISLNQLPPGI